MKMDIEQITKADRNACHTLRGTSKARATLRRLSSTVIPLNESVRNIKLDYVSK